MSDNVPSNPVNVNKDALPPLPPPPGSPYPSQYPPAYPPYDYATNPQESSKSLVALIMVIVAFFLLGYGLFLSVPGVIVAHLAKKENPVDSKAKLAFVLGLINIGLVVLYCATIVLFFVTMAASGSY